MAGEGGLIVLIKYDTTTCYKPTGGIVAKIGDVVDGVEIKENKFYFFKDEKLCCDED